jgi:hypothetical protein
MLTPIALSFAEGCAQSPRVNVLPMYASARRSFARLASEIFLSSLHCEFFSNVGWVEAVKPIPINPVSFLLHTCKGREERTMGIASLNPSYG